MGDPPPEDDVDPFGLVGQTLAGRLQIEAVVAKGGFGTVYRALHLGLQTPVAVKVLMVPERFQGESREEFLEKFRLEARTIAALGHAAVVRVLDFGSTPLVDGETPWMVLEWLDGRTLEADLEDRSPAGRSPREALDLLRPALEAMCCAHAAGIAHRDLKPANLMLVRARRGEPPLRVLDFGIAKVMEGEDAAGTGQTATKNSMNAFSLLYAAPEQVSHARTGPWTDVHALALILVEVLTGRRAYAAADAVSAFSAVLDRERPLPARSGVEVGPWAAVLARALSLQPSQRQPDAEALLSELEATVDAAEAAWRSQSTARAAETVIPVGEHALNVREAKALTSARSDAEVSAVTVDAPRAHNGRLATIGVGLALILAGVGGYLALSPSPPAPAAPAPVAEPEAPAPAPEAVTPEPTPHPVAPTPEPTPQPVAPTPEPLRPRDVTAPPAHAEPRSRRGHRRAPLVPRGSAVDAAPSQPRIVIE